jgi:hypothetical protein
VLVTPPLKTKRADLWYEHKASPKPSTFQERMKIMTTDTSATVRTEKPQVDQTTRTNTIMNALTRRAQAVLNDRLIDPQTRAIIRYGLETNDPWLAELVRRADAGESVDTLDFSQTPEGESSEEKIETLSE